ncbi:transcriptional regulator [Erythrobacter sp. EC-HK427]|uniref:transcriptional regulator n=1 Tax=Erythrobacter sp. EC-HK427 TaxID=2038396 RepID=UPI001255AD38|nr:YdaS family helix-turn-helix protein [Erythrobacter sp. EC-HK427]VVT07232.1 conserved hypothetical protein [Erythrobacter sp. EC-HK427]
MSKALTRHEALEACVDAAGTISQLGRDLGIPQSTMSRIVNSSKQLPAEYVLQAERLYGVSRHDLRPDIYPRQIMRDQGAIDRFYGVDRRAASFIPHDADDNRIYGASDFNRGGGMKAATQ